MKMRRQIVDSGFALLATAVSLITAFIIYRLVSQRLGFAIFGLWALTNAAMFPLRFADLSVNSAVMRYLGIAEGAGLRRVIGRVVAAALFTNFLAFGAFLVAALFITPTIIHHTIDSSLWGDSIALMPYLVGSALAQLAAGVFSNAMLGLHRYRFVYLTGIVVSCIQLLVVVPLLDRFGIAGYAIVQIIMYMCQVVIFGVMLLIHPEPMGSDAVASFTLREFYAFAFKLNANALLATMVEPLAKLLLGRFSTLTVVGAYEVTLRIYNQARGLLVAPMQPFAIAMIRDREDQKLFSKTYQICLLYSIVMAIGCLISIGPIWPLLKLFILVSDPTLPFIVIAIASSTSIALVSIPAYYGSIAASDVRPILLSTISYLVSTTVIGWVFGYAFGAIGVLAAVIIGNLIATAVLLIAAERQLGFRSMPRPRELFGHMNGLIDWIRVRLSRRRAAP